MSVRVDEGLQRLGQAGLAVFQRMGRAGVFIFGVIAGIPSQVRRFGSLVEQMYSVGFLTLALVVVSAFAVGMVLGLQGYNTLVDYGAEQSLGPFVALALVRELGPVLTALLFAGRAGSALAAEIGLMKATDQLSVMEMMAVDPVRRVVVPRFLAGIISMPLLAAVFSAVGVLGAHFVGVGLLGVDAGAFWSQMQESVDLLDDVLNGVIKSLVFGFVASWIAVFEGYDAVPTAEGVSRATTHAVIYTAFAVLMLDFILTALMFSN